jgi:hypothetical protein
VGSSRQLGLLGAAALSLWVPGILHARTLPDSGDQVFSIRVPVSGPPSKLEWDVGYSPLDAGAIRAGDWEVTVEFDAAKCEIHCTYRRTRHAVGTSLVDLWLPPVTAIRVYNNPESKPATMIVDPAGLRLPSAASKVFVTQEKLCVPGKRLAVPVQQVESDDPTSAQPHSFCSTLYLATISSAALPLRI